MKNNAKNLTNRLGGKFLNYNVERNPFVASALHFKPFREMDWFDGNVFIRHIQQEAVQAWKSLGADSFQP